MKKQYNRWLFHLVRRTRLLPVLIVVVILIAGGSFAIVHADSIQDQINSLNNQNSKKIDAVNSLQSQAKSYKDAINNLQAQISGLQNAISINQKKQAELQSQIDADQVKLNQQKKVLGEDIKSMYINGQMSTVEMLATSKNLSDFVDAETYATAVQNKIQSTLDQITALQNELQDQKSKVEQLLSLQEQQNSQLSSDQSQQKQLLSYNENQQASYNKQIDKNNQEISALIAEQIAANQQLVGTGRVDFSGSCGGSYPANALSSGGHWGCDYRLDNTVDNWGMYNRECVSYTAWMVYEHYGYMPYWGGVGNANQWPGDARAAHIPTGTTPRAGSVAIYMGGGTDPFGHAMWVKSVNGDGTITVDQYNLYYDGNFYETTIPAAGLVYIYFGE